MGTIAILARGASCQPVPADTHLSMSRAGRSTAAQQNLRRSAHRMLSAASQMIQLTFSAHKAVFSKWQVVYQRQLIHNVL